MSLRLIEEGVSLANFESRFGRSLHSIHGDTISKYTGYGLLEEANGRLHLTRRGRLLSNMIFRELV